MRNKIIGLIIFLAGNAHALDVKTFEDGPLIGIPFFAATHTWVSNEQTTYTLSGVLDSYAIEAVGADVVYEIRFTTRTLADGGTTGLTVHVSSAITVRSGTTKSDELRTLMWNPKISIRSLGSGGTAYTNAMILHQEQEMD